MCDVGYVLFFVYFPSTDNILFTLNYFTVEVIEMNLISFISLAQISPLNCFLSFDSTDNTLISWLPAKCNMKISPEHFIQYIFIQSERNVEKKN